MATLTDSPSSSVVARLAEDMARRWQQGERVLVEEYISQHPELKAQPEAATELIYEEICLRYQHGEGAATADVLDRFPQWREQLQVILDCHQLLQPGAVTPSFPAIGETLGDFRLLTELGRGAQGRVFLATQPALADRPVVLKLVPLLGHEHLSLARLQHTHIVPLYSVQDYPARALRALCLPYFGGLTLAALLQALRPIPLEARTGRHVLDAIRTVQGSSPVALSMSGRAHSFLARASYIEAGCWIGACLADALQYAHEHGLLHLDLKPGNVLLAADGQPMLLDFHLARGALAAASMPPLSFGGTPAYMAPEQRDAVRAVSEGRPIPVGVDHRADVYALGLLLYETLGGALPEPGASPRHNLARRNPRVSSGLAAIVGKCLAQQPAARYANAATLADDLRCHLNHLPLRGVSNRNLSERWRKWRRRRPHAAIVFVLLFLVGLGSLFGAFHVYQQLGRARTALEEGRDLLQQQQHEGASAAFRRGLALTEGMPFNENLTHELREQLRRVETVEAAGNLHQFVDRLRLLSYAEAPPAEAQALEARCRELILERRRITATLRPIPNAEAHRQAQEDLLDLTILWVRLHVQVAPPGKRQVAHREALLVLSEAEALFGPSQVLCLERQAQAAALGLREAAAEAAAEAAQLEPRTSWEHCAVGRSLLQAGDMAGAAAQFDRALALQPQNLWANFDRGRCVYQLGRYDEAVASFTACIVLAPDKAWCYHNRGRAFAELGRSESALRDFDRALQLYPSLGAAALSRGLLHLRERRFEPALADLRRALANGAEPAATHHALALVHLAQGDRAAAFADIREALRHDPDHSEARALRDRLQKEVAGPKPPL
jgi:serine/threonine protein kinase/Tfp pilus assembly protein PilF